MSNCSVLSQTGLEKVRLQKTPLHHTSFICWCSAEPWQPITLSKGLKLLKVHWTPSFLHNYPIKSALTSSLSPCPEASPHSVCKVRVPSLPQFDSVKAWKQIKSCCFSQSWRDTEPVRTRLTRGSFATRCFCLWWGLRNVGTSLHSWFCSLVFLAFAPLTHLWEGFGGTWDSSSNLFFHGSTLFFFFLHNVDSSETICLAALTKQNKKGDGPSNSCTH